MSLNETNPFSHQSTPPRSRAASPARLPASVKGKQREDAPMPPHPARPAIGRGQTAFRVPQQVAPPRGSATHPNQDAPFRQAPIRAPAAPFGNLRRPTDADDVAAEAMRALRAEEARACREFGVTVGLACLVPHLMLRLMLGNIPGDGAWLLIAACHAGVGLAGGELCYRTMCVRDTASEQDVTFRDMA